MKLARNQSLEIEYQEDNFVFPTSNTNSIGIGIHSSSKAIPFHNNRCKIGEYEPCLAPFFFNENNEVKPDLFSSSIESSIIGNPDKLNSYLYNSSSILSTENKNIPTSFVLNDSLNDNRISFLSNTKPKSEQFFRFSSENPKEVILSGRSISDSMLENDFKSVAWNNLNRNVLPVDQCKPWSFMNSVEIGGIDTYLPRYQNPFLKDDFYEVKDNNISLGYSDFIHRDDESFLVRNFNTVSNEFNFLSQLEDSGRRKTMQNSSAGIIGSDSVISNERLFKSIGNVGSLIDSENSVIIGNRDWDYINEDFLTTNFRTYPETQLTISNPETDSVINAIRDKLSDVGNFMNSFENCSFSAHSEFTTLNIYITFNFNNSINGNNHHFGDKIIKQ